MNRRLLVLVVSTLPAALAASFLWPSDSSLASRAQFDRAHSAYTPTTVKAFDEFPVYNVGTTFEDLPVRAILRRDSESELVPGRRARKDYVSFVYGECVVQVGAQACAPPLEVQVWP